MENQTLKQEYSANNRFLTIKQFIFDLKRLQKPVLAQQTPANSRFTIFKTNFEFRKTDYFETSITPLCNYDTTNTTR